MKTIVFGLMSLSFLAIVGFVISNYTNFRNLFHDACNLLTYVRTWLKRRKLKGQMEDDYKLAIDSLNNLVPELQMPELSLEWITRDGNGDVILEEGRAIVLLSYNRDNIKNLINTTTAYVQKALLPSSRYFLTEPVMKAIDFTVIKGFVARSSMKNMAMNALFYENRNDISQYQDEYNKVTMVDDNGMMTRMLLREYSLWGGRQAGHTPTQRHYQESTAFLNFLYDIIDREPDELIPLQFIGQDIKVGVLLVARPETYNVHGSLPYLRRIREGFAFGIRTFYLLARNDKIEILDLVYTELMAIGSFSLQNEAQEFTDAQGRNCICYCIEVNDKGNMAQYYKAINEYIETGHQIEVTIERVRHDELRCMYNMLIPVIIPREELTTVQDLHLHEYYIEGMTLQAIPVGLLDKGQVKASVLNTESNPQRMVDCHYAVGNVVTAIVEDPQDGLINLRIKDSDQKAVAYRNDLTYSKHLFLHKLFPVGEEFEFKIKSTNYIYNQLVLQLCNLSDPWQRVRHYPNEKVHFVIYREDEHCFVTELEEGIDAILPFSELTWMQDEIENEKKKYHRNQSIDGYVKIIDKAKRLIVMTLKTKESPYEQFFNELGTSSYEVDCHLTALNGSGIIGTVDNHFQVFIPNSETHIGNSYFQYAIGKTYKVKIIEVSDKRSSLIGSFKPYISTPLSEFSKAHSIGEEIIVGRPLSIADRAVIYTIPLSNKEKLKARLFIGDVTDNCRIDNFEVVLRNLKPKTFVISGYDYEHNNVKLSLKRLFSNNSHRREQLALRTLYHAVIIGYNYTNYIIVITDLWIEGTLPINRRYPVGTVLDVYLSGNNGELPEFFE